MSIQYQQISCILISNLDNGSLYLGSMDNAKNKDLLTQHNIKAILSVAHQQEFTHDGFIMKFIPLFDVSNQKLLPALRDCCNFIETCIKNGINVLVHCQAGASRSAAIVIGFMMYWKGLDYQEAFHYVKTIRPFIQPNKGFIKELKLWELEQFKIKRSKL